MVKLVVLYVDVVQAYKGLQKEKSVLEKSLRALSTGKVEASEKDGTVEEGVCQESGNTAEESTAAVGDGKKASDTIETPQLIRSMPDHSEVNAMCTVLYYFNKTLQVYCMQDPLAIFH